jgi:hypothetical protein
LNADRAPQLKASVRRQRVFTMKYYVYISDSKVDMLLQQIPHGQKRRLATEFKIDLKLLGATWRNEPDQEMGRIRRLEAVCEFLHEFGNVGSVDEPDQYIADTVAMNWNTYTYKNQEQEIVYFSGMTESSVLGLAGSTHHLVGGSASPQNIKIPEYRGMSTPPAILKWIANIRWANHEFAGPENWESKLKENYWLYSVFSDAQDMSGPKQNLEFLAKRLFEGDLDISKINFQTMSFFPYDALGDKSWHIMLGTPLYVAMAD